MRRLKPVTAGSNIKIDSVPFECRKKYLKTSGDSILWQIMRGTQISNNYLVSKLHIFRKYNIM